MCPRRFAEKGKVVRHERTHTGEKPYACSTCPRRFSIKSNVPKHERTHTGERPYACSMCPMRFAQKSTVARHERTHTGEKPKRLLLLRQGVCPGRLQSVALSADMNAPNTEEPCSHTFRSRCIPGGEQHLHLLSGQKVVKLKSRENRYAARGRRVQMAHSALLSYLYPE